jgi:hypothetical protein
VHPTCNQSRAISKHATWRDALQSAVHCMHRIDRTGDMHANKRLARPSSTCPVSSFVLVLACHLSCKLQPKPKKDAG